MVRSYFLLHGWPDAPRGWRAIAQRLHAKGWHTVDAERRSRSQSKGLNTGWTSMANSTLVVD